MILHGLVWLACLLAATAPVLGFARAGFGAGVVGTALLALFWLVGLHRGWAKASSLCFYVFGMLDGLSLFLGAPAFLRLISLAAALAAWDLNSFLARLERTQEPPLAAQARRSDMLRLAAALGGGLVLASGALLIHIQVRFAVALVAGALAILALSQAIQRLFAAPPSEDEPDTSIHSYKAGG